MKKQLPKNIKVIHTAFEEKPVHIANYDIGGSDRYYFEIGKTTEHDVCELIWQATQNVHDSWSNPEVVNEDGNNFDNDPSISVLVPLKIVNGKKMGHRSTSVGDQVVFEYKDGSQKTYICADVGWVEDKPQDGKTYALTGTKDDKCIANGNTWDASEVFDTDRFDVVDHLEARKLLNEQMEDN